MIRRPPRSTHCISSAASDVYKRQGEGNDLYTNRHIAIDGKTICGAINADKLVQESAGKITKEQAASAKLHIVSAFLSDMLSLIHI